MIQKTFSEHLKDKFGVKVYKLSLDGGMSCPNRDGSLSDKGCIFCSDGSGAFAQEYNGDIIGQLERAKSLVENKCKSGKYIAYFQSFSNTYAKVEYLREIFYKAISPDYIVGLAVATRPDCLGEEVVSLLDEINKIKPVTIELGLQTIKQESVKYIRRGYENEVFDRAVLDLKNISVDVVVHMIIGLPGETHEDMVNTAKYISDSGVNGIKFHLLHIIKGTDLEKDFLKGKVKVLSLEEYTEILIKCIGALREDIIIHRITGDGAKADLVAPLWSADKKRVLNYINSRI